MRALSIACAALAFLGAASSQAGSLEVNPIRVELSAAARSVAVAVKNSGTDPVVVQVSVQAWSQENGKDVLTPTKDVLVTPPIATIAVDKEQIIRVGLRRAPDAERELSYRLYVEEVPGAAKPGFQGLQVALRIGLPVFVQPRKGPAKATLVWDARLRGEDTVNLKVANQGSGHIQISDLAVSLPEEKQAVASHSALTYVLPGQSREWDFKLPPARVKKSDRLRLKVSTDAGSIDTEIDLSGP
jgi:fimbrial chaperone protein